MAVSKVTVQLEGPQFGGMTYRVGTIKGAVVLTVVGVKGEFRRGDLVTEQVAVALAYSYGVTIVAPKGGK